MFEKIWNLSKRTVAQCDLRSNSCSHTLKKSMFTTALGIDRHVQSVENYFFLPLSLHSALQTKLAQIFVVFYLKVFKAYLNCISAIF